MPEFKLSIKLTEGIFLGLSSQGLPIPVAYDDPGPARDALIEEYRTRWGKQYTKGVDILRTVIPDELHRDLGEMLMEEILKWRKQNTHLLLAEMAA